MHGTTVDLSPHTSVAFLLIQENENIPISQFHKKPEHISRKKVYKKNPHLLEIR
jgi:hypothetical protein